MSSSSFHFARAHPNACRGLSKYYETLKGAANGVTLPHLKQLGAAACVGLGVPKIRAAKLFKQVKHN